MAGGRRNRHLGRVANYDASGPPRIEDFGDVSVVLDNGATGYCRVDWFTPDGLGTWGDGRTFILGTEGYLELRKYTDVARDPKATTCTSSTTTPSTTSRSTAGWATRSSAS